MLKRVASFVLLGGLSLFALSCGYAQSFFNSPPKTELAPTKTTASKVMSPDDFQKNVANLNQKTTNAISQQLNQQLAKSKPLPPAPSNQPETKQATQSEQLNAQTPTTVTTTTETQARPAAPMQPVTTTNTQTVATPPAQVTQPVQPAPRQSETYTGFAPPQPTAPPAATNQPAANGTGSGWNIKY